MAIALLPPERLLLHYPEPERVFSEVSRVLQPNGYFYLVDPTSSRRETGTHYLLITAGGIRFYNQKAREHLGTLVGLSCLEHRYLLGSILLTRFVKEAIAHNE